MAGGKPPPLQKISLYSEGSVRTVSQNRVYSMILAALMAGVTAALALVTVPLPFSPVPVTGQTFGVMLGGSLLGPRLGAISQAIYIALGVTGLPVFAGLMAGPGVLAGPTGGYLWAFVPGALSVGWLTGRRPTFLRALGATFAGGVIVVYLIGVIQLALVTGIGLEDAALLGALPFLPGDCLKAVAAAAVAARLRPHIRVD
jgi:biotin transport system substrate-specific component